MAIFLSRTCSSYTFIRIGTTFREVVVETKRSFLGTVSRHTGVRTVTVAVITLRIVIRIVIRICFLIIGIRQVDRVIFNSAAQIFLVTITRRIYSYRSAAVNNTTALYSLSLIHI